jgi:iron complex outermembrane receptor protein
LSNISQNFAGDDLPGAPSLTQRINYSHVFDLGDEGTITSDLQFSHQSVSYQSFANSIATKVPDYTRSDFIVRYQSLSKSYFVEAFVNNIENRLIVQSVIPISGVAITYFNAPRTFGVRLGFHY